MPNLRKILPKPIKSLYHFFWAWYGAIKYHHPSEEILVIGITGTSGKSSTAFFLRQMLESCGLVVGSLSTIDFYVAGEEKLNDQKMTMLGRMQIQKYLREMVNKDCQVAIVETTSEGAVQHRNKFINYDMMVLTNLYPEHIESHGSFANYKKAKLKIFAYVARSRRKKAGKLKITQDTKLPENLKNYQQTKIPKTAIVNGESVYAQEFLNSGNFDQRFVFGYKENCLQNINWSFIAESTAVDNDGLHFVVDQYRFSPEIYGEHNIANILAAIAVMRGLVIDWHSIQRAVNNLSNAPGRVEFITEAEARGFKVIVDYAFEPVALEALYRIVELLKPKRVIHVCGSTGGGRDKSRRRPIGKLVGEKADIFIVTDEDPYDEDPLEIMKEVSAGALESGKVMNRNLFEIVDRKEAIKKAVGIAESGDLILLTGKGSEQAMCVAGNKKIPWDDREIVRGCLKMTPPRLP